MPKAITEFIRFEGELKVVTSQSMDMPKTIDRVASVALDFGVAGKLGKKKSFAVDISNFLRFGDLLKLKDVLAEKQEELLFILNEQSKSEQDWDDYVPV